MALDEKQWYLFLCVNKVMLKNGKILLWQKPKPIQVFIHGAKQITYSMPLHPARRGEEI